MRYKLKPSILTVYHPDEILLTDFSKPDLEWFIFDKNHEISEFFEIIQSGTVFSIDSESISTELKNLITFLKTKNLLLSDV
ncbi:MAG: hypothetical protein A2V66_17500 [Ignavibacteria bacterium RBG_13_36_8]|nr:MAG: hypothetical protein A2V66_17500 [Ignavibacteria bacterium RBG_13_36_8]